MPMFLYLDRSLMVVWLLLKELVSASCGEIWNSVLSLQLPKKEAEIRARDEFCKTGNSSILTLISYLAAAVSRSFRSKEGAGDCLGFRYGPNFEYIWLICTRIQGVVRA